MPTDYLTEDSLLPNGQLFGCISFLTDPDKKTTLTGIKMRGVFSTYEAACLHAKKLQSVDPYFNVFVGDMGKWLPFDPSPDSEKVIDSEYQNDELNNIMKSYVENQEKAKIFHEQRKSESMRQSVLDNLSNKQTVKKETEERLAQAKQNNKKEEIESLEINIKNIEDQIKEFENKKNDLDNQIKSLADQVGEFDPSKMAPPKVIGGGPV
jgi:hypothetical protein